MAINTHGAGPSDTALWLLYAYRLARIRRADKMSGKQQVRRNYWGGLTLPFEWLEGRLLHRALGCCGSRIRLSSEILLKGRAS